MGYDNSRIAVLLNRADSRIGISEEDVATILGRSPDVLVPSGREVAKSMTDGVPIVLAAERSEAAHAFRELAERYAGPAAAPSRNGAGEPSESKSEERSGPSEQAGRFRQLLRR
jgi:MinD-like ATPase involved in chromosome partitioning or flagellar assembly